MRPELADGSGKWVRGAADEVEVVAAARTVALRFAGGSGGRFAVGDVVRVSSVWAPHHPRAHDPLLGAPARHARVTAAAGVALTPDQARARRRVCVC